MPKQNQDSPAPSGNDSLSGCLVRLAWMLVANICLFVLAVLIAQNRETTFAVADLAYWAVVAAAVAIRYLDIQRFRGQTVTSEPATMAHWRRYVMLFPAAALVVWGIAHGIALLGR
jgi:hypothetical protein